MSTAGERMQRQRKDLLLSAERGNKADIQAYTSGHLRPNSLVPKPIQCRPQKPNWETSQASGPSRLQESRLSEDHVKEMIDAWYNFTINTNTLQQPEVLTNSRSFSERSWSTSMDPYEKRDPAKLSLVKPNSDTHSVEVDQGHSWFTQSYSAGLTWSDQLKLRRQFDRQVLRKQDLSYQKCMSGRQTAERHERKLQQELRKLPQSSQREEACRRRLAVFSDVFDDVCDGSPAFGNILREIKMEYDLYLNSVISSQSGQDVTPPPEDLRETVELEEAVKKVSSLEDKARRALKENDRVRTEYKDAQAKALEKQREKGSCDAGESGLSADREGEITDQTESSSSVVEVEVKRQQVWRRWRDVQNLQKEIRETLVSTVTTSSLQEFIRDTEAEIKHLTTSNEQLRSNNKGLEQNISMVLTRAKVSEETRAQVWQKIKNTVHGED